MSKNGGHQLILGADGYAAVPTAQNRANAKIISKATQMSYADALRSTMQVGQPTQHNQQKGGGKGSRGGNDNGSGKGGFYDFGNPGGKSGKRQRKEQRSSRSLGRRRRRQRQR